MHSLKAKHSEKLNSEQQNARKVNIYIKVGVHILSMTVDHKLSWVGFFV